MPFIAIALLIAAALGGGTAIAAEQSLPSDALWGFKVNVNESIRGALSASDEAKAHWDINAIETRLSEAHKLAATSRLSAKAQANIEANLQSHVHGVSEAITKLEALGEVEAAAEIAARFQAAMQNHASVLAEAEASAGPNVRATLTPLLSSVRSTLDKASGLSAEASAKAAAEAKGGNDTNDDNPGTTSVNATGTVHVDAADTLEVGGSGSAGVEVR